MADRFTYSTIKPSSIDFETGANRLMQASVEQRLADIEQKRAMATESQKAVLDAMSVKKIQGMTRGLQERHQMDVDAHRKGIIDMVSKSGGTLTAPQQMQIQNEREDLETKAMASVQAVKERDEVRKFLLNPNTQYGYDVGAISAELKDWDDSFAKGEYKGDPRTILFKHQIEAPASDYVSKNYADLIDSLDVEELGEFKGNVFESTTLKGLEVSDPDSYDKVLRARDRMMQDPNIVRRYTANDGSVFEDKKKQVQAEIEDVISKKIKETSKGRTSTRDTSDSYEEFYIDSSPYQEEVKGDIDSFGATVTGSIPVSRIASYYHKNKRVIPERIVMMPVAKNSDTYNSRIAKFSGKRSDIEETKNPIRKHSGLIIDDNVLGEFDRSEYEYVPMLKAVIPKKSVPDWANADWLNQNNIKTEIEYYPYDSDAGSQFYSKMTGKQRAGFDKALSELRGSANSNVVEEKYSKGVEAAIAQAMKQNPDYTREEIIEALGLK